MRRSPSVSVVIPTYNRAEQTCRAVRSVLEGTLLPDQVLVIDDGSTDDTAVRVRALGEDLVDVIVNKQNSGVASARNMGLEMARNRWIALLDSDDVWLPHHLETLAGHIVANPEIRVVQGLERWYRNGVRVNSRNVHQPQHGDIFELSLQRCLVSSSAVLLDRDMVIDAGGYDERMPVCEDYDLWLRLARNHRFGLVEKETISKDGPRSDQLSRKYWGMDRFRVFSMVKLLSEGLPEHQAEATRQICLTKLGYLAGGARRRGRNEAATAYESWATAVRSAVVRKPSVASSFSELPVVLQKAGFGLADRATDPILSTLRWNHEKQTDADPIGRSGENSA